MQPLSRSRLFDCPTLFLHDEVHPSADSPLDAAVLQLWLNCPPLLPLVLTTVSIS